MQLEELVLPDGERLRVRPMRRADRAKYVAGVAALSPRSRYQRFAAPIPKLSERQIDQMMCIDGERHVVLGAFTADEQTGVGVARYIRLAESPSMAEVAIAIADDYQGRGLGRELLERLTEHARVHGVELLVASMLSENHASARLARAIGFSILRRSGVNSEYEMWLQR